MRRIEYQAGQMIGGCVFIHEIAPYIGPSGREHRRGLFKCLKCSSQTEFECLIQSIKQKKTTSCGCVRITINKNLLKTHGLGHTPLNKLWNRMNSRCYCKTNPGYKWYGARGISVCDEWRNDFKAFYDYVTKLPHYGEDGRTIDRIDNDGNYEPGNVRWGTKHEQGINQRMGRNNKTGYTGVSQIGNRYKSQIGVYGQLIYLGTYGTPEEAVTARNNYIIKHKLWEYPIQKIKI